MGFFFEKMVVVLNLQNNQQLVFGNVYGGVMLPKEVELNKGQNLDLKFQVPDIGKSFKVYLSFLLFEVYVTLVQIFTYVVV